MKKLLLFFLILPISFSQITKEGQEMVNTCTNALMQKIPPMFCWKEGPNIKVFPNVCPKGYKFKLGQCQKLCNRGDKTYNTNICYKPCPKGMVEYQQTKCKEKVRGIISTKIHYYIERLNIHDPRVKCSSNKYYKTNGVCVYNCNLINMENCGGDACSLDKESCKNTIIEMIKDVIEGIIDFISFCFTLGTSSGVTIARKNLHKGLLKVNKNIIKAAFKSIKIVFKSKFKETIKSGAKQAAKNLFKTFIGKSQNEVNNICEQVYRNIENRVKRKSNLPSKEELLKAIDVFEISNIVSSCGKKDAYQCTKACLETAKNFDPTGLLTIATTFMKPKCKINVGKINRRRNRLLIEDDYDIFYKEKNDCIRLYYDKKFKGEFNDICGDASLLKNPISIRNNILNSYILFSEYNFEGERILLGKGGKIYNIEEFLEKGEKIKSIKKVNDNCLYAFNKGKLYEICKNIDNIDFNEDTDFEIFSNNLIVDIYSEENYKGNHLRLKNNENKLNTIKSIKIHFNYETFGFICNNEINTNKIIRKNINGEIECFSMDGENCIEMSDLKDECVDFIQKNIDNSKPISCQKDIPRLIDIKTNGMPNWCIESEKYFKKIEKSIE